MSSFALARVSFGDGDCTDGRSFVPSLRQRFRIGLVLLAVLAWISLGLPVSGMLRTLEVASGMCLGLQLAMLLLSLDIVAGAVVNLARGRFGAAGFWCF